MTGLNRWWGALGVCLAVPGLLAIPAQPAQAGPLPNPSDTYETDALQTCATGELECVRSVLDVMRQHTRELAETCDHNAMFAALYTIVTAFYYETVAGDPEFFSDPAFVNHEDAVFAHYYFWPYVNWRAGARRAVPPAWRVAFEAADAQDVTAAGNLLLGINAHVVRDLPFVLAALGMGDKRDHDRVNDILRAAYGPAMRTLDDHLADSIDDANIRATTLDDDAVFQIVVSWREQAWHDAQRLSSAWTDIDRAIIAAEIEQKAYVQATSFRSAFAYGPDVESRAQRNAYCREHAWPPDWLGGDMT